MDSKIKNAVLRFLIREDGPTTVEYAIMLGIIIISSIGAVLTLGDFQQSLFFDSANAMNQAMPN
jgi:Flp pilus assembly pilin Flp